MLEWVTPAITSGLVLRDGHAWIPEAGLDFALRMDSLAWMFCLLILGIGALVVLYAHHYLAPKDKPAPVFLLSPAVHGRDARDRAGRESAAHGGVLGAHQHYLVPFDRVLVPAARMSRLITTSAPGQH